MPREVDEWFWQEGVELHRLNEEMASGRPRLARARFWEPRVDLVEEDGLFFLKAEIAGVRGEDIQLLFLPERHSLILRGQRQEEPGDGLRVGIHQLEIYYGEFQREVVLPAMAIDASAIRAQYRNGMLLVTIPKAERPKTSVSVTITKF